MAGSASNGGSRPRRTSSLASARRRRPQTCGVALFIAAFTISDAFTIGFVGDRDSMPHTQRLAVYTGEALQELETALAVAG
jgi:hypothetical protein